VLPWVGLDTDEPFWITRDAFLRRFDQADFHRREVADVQAAYLSEWFGQSASEATFFKIPTVGLLSSGTQFVYGRHRAAVLLNCLDEIPIAFAINPLSNLCLYKMLDKRPLELTKEIVLPDLPINTQLPHPSLLVPNKQGSSLLR
jgi:hypothetical protein